MGKFREDIKGFANKFLELQEKRHQADYDPIYRLTRSEVLTEINVAEAMILKLLASPTKDKNAFSVWTVMKKRS